MAIEFLCPTGHKLSCSDDLAGKAGKCPKCGAGFRVPLAAGSRARASDSQESYPELDDVSQAEDAPAEASPAPAGQPAGNGAPAEASIIFLCPNGHKLNAPLGLQGRKGQCPHCNARFVIPEYDAQAPDENVEVSDGAPLSGDQDTVQEFDPAYFGGTSDDDGQEGLLTLEAVDEVELGVSLGLEEAGPLDSEHPMAALVSRLWEERAQGCIIELHTRDGSSFTPHWFAKQQLRQNHGLFGVQELDGSLQLNVVTWDAITRVVVRGLRQLPSGMFE